MNGLHKPGLPVMRLELLQPVLEEAERSGVNYKQVLHRFSIAPESLADPDIWLPASTVYAVVEELADVSGDSFFGINAGERLDPWAWSPTAGAAMESKTVGEFLLRFMEDASEDVNSCVFVLNTTGNRTSFREQRVSDCGILPRHNDGYTIAWLLTIIRGAMGAEWDGRKVLAQVCDPGVVPVDYLGIRTAITDSYGATISFPSRWLIHALTIPGVGNRGKSRPLKSQLAANFVDAFHYAVSPHLHVTDLNADRIAEICGLSKRTLARKLQENDTHVRGEINKLKLAKVRHELLTTTSLIYDIGLSVGYTDPVVFSRAFKRWTGKTPSEFRAEARLRKSH